VARGSRQAQKLSKSDGYIRIGAVTANLLEDPNSVLDWDDDELRAGCRRNSNGRFPAAKSTVIPRVVYDELMKRTIDHCMEKMRHNMPEMIDIMMVIIRDPGVQARDKLKAIEMMMNRVFGKPTERIVIKAGQEKQAWQKALDIAIVNEPDVVDDEEFE
jgi:hypothetical protein